MHNFIKYYNTKSLIHDMNPLYKIICTLIFTLLIIMSNNIFITISLLIFLSFLIILSNVPIDLYLKNLKYSLSIIIFIIIINLIFNISILNTIAQILKLILFILYSNLLIYTTKPNDLTYGLEKLFNPLRITGIPVKSLALSISLSIRFIPIIFKEGNKVLKSQISRGLNFDGSIKEKIDKIISVIIPIFVLSLKRSDELANALELRFYKPEGKRTKYKEYEIKEIDKNILCIHLFLLFIFIVVEVLL